MTVSPNPLSIAALKARHEELSRQTSSAEPAAVLPEVEQFITEIRQGGRFAGTGSERDLLRTLAAYWATFVYQHSPTGAYPSTELEPYLGPPVKNVTVGKWVIPEKTASALRLLIPALIGILGLFLLAQVIPSMLVQPTPTYPTVPSATLPLNVEFPVTLTALSEILTRETGATVVTLTPTLPPTATDSPTATGWPTPTPIFETPTATLAPVMAVPDPVIAARVTNLVEGQEVHPDETVSVQYANLRPGWSVHLLLQPLDQAARYFPSASSLLIGDTNTSGVWQTDLSFDSRLGTQFNLVPVIAVNDEARALLASAAQNGLNQLPDSLIPLPQVLTVSVSATDPVNELRLIYASYASAQGRMEIFTTRPDGSDLRQITSSLDWNKLYPALSPDGRQIVFVGRRINSWGAVSESLWLIDSSGQNASLLLDDPQTRYERPVWSADGRALIFSAAASPIPGADPLEADWHLYIYDIAEAAFRPIAGLPDGARFPAMFSDNSRLVFSAIAPGSGTRALFQFDLTKGDLSLIFDDPHMDDSQPALSPDGSQLVFTSYPVQPLAGPFTYTLALLSADWAEPRPLIIDSAATQFPRWHPDGRLIFFESNRTGSFAIWTVDASGREILPLTSGVSDRWPFAGHFSATMPNRSQP